MHKTKSNFSNLQHSEKLNLALSGFLPGLIGLAPYIVFNFPLDIHEIFIQRVLNISLLYSYKIDIK